MDLWLSSSNTELNKSNKTIILHFKLLFELLVYRVYNFFFFFVISRNHIKLPQTYIFFSTDSKQI